MSTEPRKRPARGPYKKRPIPPVQIVRSSECMDDHQRAELARLLLRLLMEDIRDGYIEQAGPVATPTAAKVRSAADE